MTKSEQKRDELDVFQSFAAVAPLRIERDSIKVIDERNRPDVECTTEPGEHLAFELTEILDDGVARQRSGIHDDFDVFDDLVNDLGGSDRARLLSLHSMASFQVRFNDRASRNRHKAGARALVLFLAEGRLTQVDRTGIGGTLALPDSREFSSISSVHVSPRAGGGPYFSISAGGPYRHPVVDAVKKKLEKPYKTGRPIELLMYVDRQPRVGLDVALVELEGFLNDEFIGGQFRRVWVFDLKSANILFAFPPN